ncbi:uncharacterized protein YhaN [Virgibacillus natechei]|uniref:Uncharacterized protein YhaN n=1 Tax=Virgibacillus natechei TaxID=1216297 RepID=A0ABS4IDF2_9BACI|nr:AAA family ATPase [Virgibacillus natechei]MBP1968972.1 uncharacterized protein YhaN [Virgibacillus natechei]UZD14250.1 AAA family ATPase [Virgibacillus natechei]
MKLSHAFVYGFGKWIDFEIDFTSESAKIIYGENESGKSTLQKFILFMLFGLPPKQRAFYRPKTSGKMGGRLTIKDSVCSYTIERFDEVKNGAATCYISDGSEQGEEWLKERLKGMTYSTYQSIFSFTAVDLHTLEEMKEDDFGEVLLAIGLTGSNNIYNIEKKLDNQIGELFKPYGKKPAINQQLDSLNDLFAKLQSSIAEEATYREKQAKLAFLTQEKDRLQGELQQEKRNLFSIEKKQQVLPIVHEYHHYTTQLTSYPKFLVFPENGVERLEKLNGALLPLQSELAVWEDNQERYNEKIVELQEKLEDSMYEEAQLILQKKEQYKESKKELKRIQSSLDTLSNQLNTEINQLNTRLESDELSTIVLPFHIEKTWHQIKNNSDQLALDKEQLRQEKNQSRQQRNYVINQQQELEDELLTDKYRRELDEKINEYKEHDLVKKLKRESVQKQKEWENKKTIKEKNIHHMLIGSIVFSMLAGIIALFTESPWVIYLIPILLIVGVGQWVWGRKTIRDIDNVLIQDELQVPSFTITKEEREEAEKLLTSDNRNRNERGSLREQLKSIDIQFIKLDEKQKMIEGKEERLHAQLSVQYEAYPFLEDIDVNYWPEFYYSLKQLLKLDRERNQSQAQRERLQESQHAYHQEVNRFLNEKSSETITTSCDHSIEIIENMLQMYQNTSRQLEQYQHLVIENTQKQRETKQKMHTYEKAIKKLLDSAEVETIDTFYKTSKQLEAKQEIEEKRNKTMERIRANYPDEQILEESLDESGLEIRHQESQAAIEQIEKDINKKRDQLAEVSAEIDRMELSEMHSKTIHRYQMETESLNKLAKQWAVFKTAKEMLIETKRTYRNKYLHKVMDRTSYYFKELTGAFYHKVYAPTDNKPFQVESNDNLRYTVNELSQGTIDQLYVSLRLAISEVMSEKHRLPFMIDDAFVNFDAIRTKRIMKIIEEISETQQMIIFTCKKEVVKASKKAEIIDLDYTTVSII